MLSDIKRLQPGERITAESYNALVDVVQALRRIATSFPLAAHRSPAGLQISLATQPKWEFMELDEHIGEFEQDKRAKRLGYKPDEEADKWYDTECDAESLADPQAGAYLKGERRLCYFHPAAGRYVPVESPLWHIGKLDEDIGFGGIATVSLWQMDSEGGLTDSELNVEAYDWLLVEGKKLTSGTRVVVQFLVHARKWIITQAGECPEDT